MKKILYEFRGPGKSEFEFSTLFNGFSKEYEKRNEEILGLNRKKANDEEGNSRFLNDDGIEW